MYEIIEPNEEIFERLGHDVTEAITPEELKELYNNNVVSIILVDNSTYIALMIKYKRLIILALNGGGSENWLEYGLIALNDIAKHNGCEYVKFMGRRGWKRKLEKFNYVEKGIIMEYKLDSNGVCNG